jgi:FkbM family methyltransferase
MKSKSPSSPGSRDVADTLRFFGEILGDWKDHLKRYETPEHRHKIAGVENHFIEPYIIETRHAGIDAFSLISTLETKAWYDTPAWDEDIELISMFRMIKPGATVFDLGASHGSYAVFLAKMAGPGGTVYAFEPFEFNADFIRFNARLNNVDIQVFEVALSDRAGDSHARILTQCIADSEGTDLIPIRLDTLNNYAHLKPDFLKIDIEGAEIDALKACDKILRLRPNIHLEVHCEFYPRFGYTVKDLVDLLPVEDYLVYIKQPGLPLQPFTRDFEINRRSTLYLVKEEPVRRYVASATVTGGDDIVWEEPTK